MNKNISRNSLLFYITKNDIQHEALRKLGRKLTKEELEVAKKGLESGLLTGIDTIYSTIFKIIEKES